MLREYRCSESCLIYVKAHGACGRLKVIEQNAIVIPVIFVVCERDRTVNVIKHSELEIDEVNLSGMHHACMLSSVH